MSRRDRERVDVLLQRAFSRDEHPNAWTPDTHAARSELHRRMRQTSQRPIRAKPKRRAADFRWGAPLAAAALTATLIASSAVLAGAVLRPHRPHNVPQASVGHWATRAPLNPPASFPSPSHMDWQWQFRKAKELCGPGYRALEQTGSSGGIQATGLTQRGLRHDQLPKTNVWLWWNPTTQQACVTTVKDPAEKTTTRTTAYLQPDHMGRTSHTGRDAAVVHLRLPESAMPPSPGSSRHGAAPTTCFRWGGSDGNARFDSEPVHYSTYNHYGDPC